MIAVFGGTFDPPHLGHREALRGLFTESSIRKALIVPSASPPHKPCHAPSHHREAMARLNFTSTLANPFPSEVEFYLGEMERAQATGKPNYTYDTLTLLAGTLSRFAFVIGADQLRDLPTWYRFPEVLKLTHWLVLERLPFGNEIARKTLKEWEASGLVRKVIYESAGEAWAIRESDKFLRLIPTQAPPLSSTEIRETISRSGSPPIQSLLPEVWGYLKQKGLYGTERK